MIKRVLVVVSVVFGLSVAQAGTEGEDVCVQFEQDVVGKVFVAKAPLYDTKVDKNRIKKLERDREEIPKGREFSVLKVSCGGSNIEMVVRQNEAYKAKKIEIYLLFKKRDRVLEGAEKTLKQITDHIYEEPKEDPNSE